MALKSLKIHNLTILNLTNHNRMKKLLLSALCLAGVASMASATDTTLDVNDATNFVGTLNEEKPAEGSSNGQAKNYSPIESLEIDGFKFAFTKGGSTTNPAYYWSMSTAANQQQTIRLYSGKSASEGNTMTITAPAGTTFGSIEFTGTNGKANGAVDASVGSVVMESATAMTWTNSEAVNAVTLTFKQNFRITKMVVKSEGGEVVTPPEPTGVTFTKATTMETGKYIFVIDGKIACPIKASYSYGYMYLDVEATIDGDDIVTDEANALNVTVADGKITLLDPNNRYYGMDETHLSSFQCYNEVTDGCYWNYEFGDGGVLKLTSELNPDCFVCKTTYNNIAPTKAPEEFTLPVVYKLKQSGIAAVEAENDVNAPVVYYNLQGQRVANPENGLYIRVQGNKVEKVAIR